MPALPWSGRPWAAPGAWNRSRHDARVITSTQSAISPDSGQPWAEAGAWPVAEGLWRIPLPLPSDGLKAVNVYVLETDQGLTLIDGGWAIEVSRNLLEKSLGEAGHAITEIRQFLVTHVHRDHYTQAVAVGREVGATVSLGIGDKPTLDMIHEPRRADDPHVLLLRAAGAHDLSAAWAAFSAQNTTDPTHWEYPDTWLTKDHEIPVGSRRLAAVHTPGHTQGHFVFHDAQARMLFAGDHVLPTITPSIGFEPAPAALPLGDFLGSLTKVRGMPDAQLLPAHGPITPSAHARIDELLAHHAHRLDQCAEIVQGGSGSALDVAAQLGWTRHERTFSDLDVFNAALAVLETRAHLELLAAQDRLLRAEDGGVATYSALPVS